MTKDKLQQLTPDQLHKYFLDNAKYHKENPENSQYSIRIGTDRALFSHDTHELFEKFKAALTK